MGSLSHIIRRINSHFLRAYNKGENKARAEPARKVFVEAACFLKTSISNYISCTLTLVLASILAPRSSNNFTMLAFPLFDATCRSDVILWKNRNRKYSVIILEFKHLPCDIISTSYFSLCFF